MMKLGVVFLILPRSRITSFPKSQLVAKRCSRVFFAITSSKPMIAMAILRERGRKCFPKVYSASPGSGFEAACSQGVYMCKLCLRPRYSKPAKKGEKHGNYACDFLLIRKKIISVPLKSTTVSQTTTTFGGLEMHIHPRFDTVSLLKPTTSQQNWYKRS